MKKNILILISFFSLHGCIEMEIDYIKPTTAKELVVHCLFNPDEVWNIQVECLGNVMDRTKADLSIQNATVFLYENSVLIDTLHWNGKKYISFKNRQPQFNRNYKIEVECDGYETVSSNYEILPDSINLIHTQYFDTLKPDIFPAEVYFTEQWLDYGMIEITLSVKKGQKIIIKDFVTLSNASSKNFINYPSLNYTIYECLHTGTFLLQAAVISTNSIDIGTVSESGFLYELSSSEYEFVTATTHLLTPNNVFSNMSNGIGIMSGMVTKRIKVL